MRNRFLIHSIAKLLLFFCIVGTPSRNNAQNKVAGKIVKIGCEGYWRKTEKSQEERLKKKDEGRTLYVEEGVRCAKAGVLELLVYDQPVKVDASKGWYTLPENTEGEEDNTGGRRGEELTWMTGTYRLNEAESDSPALQMQFFRQSINREVWQYSRRDPSDVTPRYFAFKLEDQKLTFASSETPPLTFSTDGQMRTSSLNGGNFLRLQASAAKDQLDITWILNDVVTALIKVRPIENGKKLIFNWIIRRKDHPTPQQFKAVYDRQSSEAHLDVQQWSAATTSAGTATGTETSGRMDDEIMVAELLEPISVKAGNPTTVTLRIIEPERLRSIIAVEVKTQAEQIAPGSALMLRFNATRVADGRVEPFAVTLERVVSANGDVLADKSDIRQQANDPSTVVLSRGFDIPAGSRFILRKL